MKTKDYVRLGCYAIIMVVFNFLFFLQGGADVEAAGWMAYGFAHLALIVSCAAPFLCIHYKRIPENLSTIYVFAWLYGGVGFVFNVVILLLHIQNIKPILVINVILLAVYLIQLLINMNVNYTVEKNIETVEAERQFVRATAGKLQMVMQLCASAQERRVVEKAYDAVRTCPLHSNDNVINYEVEIMRLVDNLEKKIANSDYEGIDVIVQSIVMDCKKRNAML